MWWLQRSARLELPPRGTDGRGAAQPGATGPRFPCHPPAAHDAATGPLHLWVSLWSLLVYLKSADNVLTRAPSCWPEPRGHPECPGLRRWGVGSPDPKGTF